MAITKTQAAVSSPSMTIVNLSLRRSRRLLASSQAFACSTTQRTVPSGPQFAPLHPFAQKEPQRFDHRLGWAARTTLIAMRLFNPVNQTGHQAACRRSHRPSPVSITRKAGRVPHPQPPQRHRSLSANQPIYENRALSITDDRDTTGRLYSNEATVFTNGGFLRIKRRGLAPVGLGQWPRRPSRSPR